MSNMARLAYITWGEADEELWVEYDIEPADPSVGIFHASVRDATVYTRLENGRRGPEWPPEKYASEYEALMERLDEFSVSEPEDDPDLRADLAREDGR